MSSRAMVSLVHAGGFFPEGDAEKYATVTRNMNFQQKPYGKELDNFNMILPGMEPIFSRVLGEKVIIDNKRSGIFRRPMRTVHFEAFDTLNEWCFVVALEKTAFNVYHHLGSGQGEVGVVNAKSALDGWQFNYRNLFEWNIESNIVLQPNEGVFFRPWVFHSIENDALVQYYRLLTDRSFRVLVMGDDNEERHKLAKIIHEKFESSIYWNSRDLRVREKDIDYSEDGQSRHAYRVLNECRNTRSDLIIVDAQSKHSFFRETINPDIIIWVNTKPTREDFEKPQFYDFRVKTINDEIVEDIVERIKTKRS